MKSFIVSTLTILLVLCAITVGSLLYLPANVAAEYWVRPLIMEKEAIAAAMPSPRIIFLGGSSTLFSIDARGIERQTGVPTVNFGMHAGLPLPRMLREADRVTRRGDVLVLMLEQKFYACDALDWSPWALRGALAWDHEDFAGLPLLERGRAAFTAGTPGLLMEQWGALANPPRQPERDEALKPRDAVLADFRSGSRTPSAFEYSQFNIDDHGDMMHTQGTQERFDGFTGLEDVPVCPRVIDLLARFVASQRSRGVTVAVAHHPYLIAGKPDPAWPEAEARFKSAIAQTGAILIDDRSETFLAPEDFFNMNGHLNEQARARQTARLVRDLGRLQLLPRPAVPGANAAP